MLKGGLRLAFVALFVVGCSHQPTKVYETRELDFKILVENAKKPLQISDKTIVIDSRSSFDYTMAHPLNSIHLQWQDFVNGTSRFKGALREDLFAESRRLARMGVAPDSSVVVLGSGSQGEGAEGRLAWTLLYLGVRDVQFAEMSSIKWPLTNQASKPLESQKIWKPQVVDSLLIKKDMVQKVIASPLDSQNPTRIIDVRTAKEYFNKGGFGEDYKYPDINAINIEWTKFFNSKGRPNWKMKKELLGLGVTSETKIILISNEGIRSAAVTAALVSLGYPKATNYNGGYKDLFSNSK